VVVALELAGTATRLLDAMSVKSDNGLGIAEPLFSVIADQL